MALRVKRRQKAVLWMKIGVDRDGTAVLDQPREIKVRWESGNRTTRKQVGTVDVKAIVGEKISEGSVLWLGKLANLPDPNEVPAFDSVSVYEVIEYQECPDVKDAHPIRNVLMMRKGATIPNPT